MELNKVSISNFQSHKESELEFTDGVNVIIGPSDAGKSAIFRAIYWVITNRPLGDGFRSYWGGNTRVDLHFNDFVVSRLKGDSDNQYIITNESPIVLKAFGTDTPEEVVKLLALDNINIQSQIDPPFLLANTSGEVAQMLNKAASIDDIDRAMTNLKSIYNEAKRNKTYLEKQIADMEEELKQYDNLPRLEQLVEELERIENEAEVYTRQYSNLEFLVDKIYNVQEELTKFRDVDKYLSVLDNVFNMLDELNIIENKFKQLSDLVYNIKSVESSLVKFKDVDKYLSILNTAFNTLDELNLIKGKFKQIADLVYQIKSVESSLAKTEETINKLEKEYKELAPDTCPLCGGPMPKEGLA